MNSLILKRLESSCKAFAPVFEKISEEYSILCLPVTPSMEQNFAAAFGIVQSLPP